MLFFLIKKLNKKQKYGIYQSCALIDFISPMGL